MFTSRPIGFVRSPYKDTSQVPRGLGAKHEADGVLAILPEFEAGLTDIGGFSHLVVLWEFDRSNGFELEGGDFGDNPLAGLRVHHFANERIADVAADVHAADLPRARRRGVPE